MSKYNNDLFDRIDEEKQKKIFAVASSEFAKAGFSAANINMIAEKIGISVGSLYKYFSTKENLFLSTVHWSRRQLEEYLEKVSHMEEGLFEKIEALICIIQEHSTRFPELIQLYNVLTSEGNQELATKLSDELESLAAEYYTEAIREAQSKGFISNPSPPEVLAFFLDNLFLNLQFSYANAYYRERMRLFIGEDVQKDDTAVRVNLLDFIKRAFGAV